jgi:hypothetical protein
MVVIHHIVVENILRLSLELLRGGLEFSSRTWLNVIVETNARQPWIERDATMFTTHETVEKANRHAAMMNRTCFKDVKKPDYYVVAHDENDQPITLARSVARKLEIAYTIAF